MTAVRVGKTQWPSPRRIKQGVSYEVAEVAELLGVHRNTVRRWLKEGLAALDDRRPILIHGSVLKAFLARRRHERRKKCRPGEFYCFRCRLPRAPWGGLADVSIRTAEVANLSALCACCETPMHRAVRRADLPALAFFIDLRVLAPERLNDRSNPSANRAFEEV
jgi:excisionase family DNA binding protein